MRVLIIVGLVVFVAAFLGAWIAVLVMARKAAKARELREREAWRGDRDDSTPGGPGAAALPAVGSASAAFGSASLAIDHRQQPWPRIEQAYFAVPLGEQHRCGSDCSQ